MDLAMDDLAHIPSGGPAKKWFVGFMIAAMPVIYGIYCIYRGHATLFGTRRSHETLTGEAGLSLAIAYISLGAFLHFQYFWGLSDRLWRYSQRLKLISLLIFLPAFIYAHYRAFV